MPNKTKPPSAMLPVDAQMNEPTLKPSAAKPSAAKPSAAKPSAAKPSAAATVKQAMAEDVIKKEKVTQRRVSKKAAIKKEPIETAVKQPAINKAPAQQADNRQGKKDALAIKDTIKDAASVSITEQLDKQPLDKGLEGIDIGSRVSHLRLLKGYSQRKLARLAGFTNTAISAIERNKVSPAVNTLNAILAVLDSDLQSFFSEDWEEATTQVIVKPKDLVEISEANSGVSIKQVHSYATHRNLGFLLETYQPNSSTEEKIVHEGEEIGTVIEGEIVIHTDNTAYFLTAGDSYVIDTSHPHTFVNPSANITRIVSAHTPATF